MSFSITKTDFQFFLSQFMNFVSIVADLDTIDMTGVLSKTYYSIPVENGDRLVTVPLVSACDTCDNSTFSYDTSEFRTILAAFFTAWENYFANYYGDSEITSVNDFMLANDLAVPSTVDDYYFLATRKHFYAGCIYKPNNTIHFQSVYASSTNTWTNSYVNYTYTGNSYNILSASGTSTKPQIMKASCVGGTGDTIKLAVKLTYQTTGENYVQTVYLEKTSGTTTNVVSTEVPVIKLLSAEIVNSQNYTLKTTAIPNAITLYVKYSDERENDGSLTIVDPTTSNVTNGIVRIGDPDYKYVDSLEFYHSITAVPNAGYYFNYWASDVSQNNNPTYASDNYSHSPVLGTFNAVTVAFNVDGEAYTGDDIWSDITCDSKSEDGYYSGNITIIPAYNHFKYEIDTLTWTATGGSGTWTSGVPVALNSAYGAYVFSVNLKSVANITFATSPAESTLDGYVVKFLPDVLSASGNPALYVDDVVDISARLVDNVPSEIYVFKKWTGSNDYVATKSKTLSATNSYTAELVYLGASPTETTVTFSVTGGTATCKDLTNLSETDEPTPLVADEAYAAYVGAFISFELIATGTSASWYLDGSETPFATTLTAQLDLPITAGPHTIDCVIVA